MRARSLALSAVLLAGSTPLAAQSLADRMGAVDNDVVTFHYRARPGICGDGERFIRTGRSSYEGSLSSGYRDAPCITGPVQVRLTVVNGAVTRVQRWVGPPRSREARDLGAVSAAEAARYLMTIAERGTPSASAKAIFPAVLADSARVWPALLAIAHDDDTRSRATRQEALLWLSRFASGAVSGHPDDPFDDDGAENADDDVKSHAVFVLSQLHGGAGVPSLLEVARSNPSPHVRSHALFWLGQSGDPRALELFESILQSAR